MITQSFVRATRPHMPSLIDALTPLLAVANAGGFHVTWTGAAVVVEQGAWTNVNMQSVAAAVAAASDADTIEASQAQETAQAIQIVLQDLPSPAQIDTTIDNVFANHTVGQRLVLKKLAKTLRAVALRSIGGV